MSEEKQDGGQAFPRTGGNVDGPNCPEWVEPQPGMSLRDYFAGQALAGMNASLTNTADWPTAEGRELMAEIAYRQADAMLFAREDRS